MLCTGTGFMLISDRAGLLERHHGSKHVAPILCQVLDTVVKNTLLICTLSHGAVIPEHLSR